MDALYQVVRFLAPPLAAVVVTALGLAWARHRTARLPPVPLLPEHSQSPHPAAQRRYRRLLRRKPHLRTQLRPADMPRRWGITAGVLGLLALVATSLALPDGAHFQVKVERMVGYPATVVELRVPASAQAKVLQAWQPVLQPAARQVVMRYRLPRTNTDTVTTAVQPIQVRQRGDLLQVATAVPVDHDSLRQALADCVGIAPSALQVHDDGRFAPAWQMGWAALAD
ncbi:hypothetical protein [Stenotrophomonas sp. 24(2023)]|uniref:hypothetical protein n=1 Tax=Stenotrophomonas sp. 24(2023) TaxID=3068324 RepID=UPI0027E1F321|nr:hypothetical protein [Stenotrophomonas sp. 24(2023)]WMJ67643.1 hypothetical protein Q9R17_10430 [Stenotrophomonas sp. 24(2023)]